jgi:hypothetical protein
MIQPYWRTYTTSALAYTNPFSGETGAASTSALYHPPRAITVGEGTLNGNAPGAGTYWLWRLFTGFDPTTENGVAVTVSETATSQRTTTTATLLAADGTDVEGSANYLRWYPHSSPAQSENMIAFGYEDSADSSINYHGWGSYSFNIMSGKTIATDYFTTFGIGGTAATLTPTEANVKMIWPATGAFKYCAVVYTTPGGGIVTLAMRIDGEDSGYSFTIPAGETSKTLTTDLTASHPIVAGQTVNWRVNQASSVGFTCSLIVGFITT